MILLIIFDDIYEVSKYIHKHPGEGISNTYLKNYNLKNSSKEFDKYHYTDEPFKMLEDSKNNKFYNVNNIYYVCPNFFRNRIPKYFKFFENYQNADLFMLNSEIKFVLFQSFKNNDSELNFYWKDNNQINKSLIYKNNNIWNFHFNNILIFNKYIENIINELIVLFNLN